MLPYKAPERVSSDQGGSTRFPIPYKQEGLACSSINTAYTFIPCDLDEVTQVLITPVKLSTTSDNGVALFTTTVGWEADDMDYEDLSAITDVDDWAVATAYNIGTVVLNPDDDTAYICIEAHTSTDDVSEAADWVTDLAAGYWQVLPSTTLFVKLTHTAAGGAKVCNFNYQLVGYKK